MQELKNPYNAPSKCEDAPKANFDITENESATPDNPINPSHYKNGKMDAIKIMEAMLTPEEFKGFLKGLIVKYLYRADNKNGIEDYKKAQWYMNKLVSTVEKKLK